MKTILVAGCCWLIELNGPQPVNGGVACIFFQEEFPNCLPLIIGMGMLDGKPHHVYNRFQDVDATLKWVRGSVVGVGLFLSLGGAKCLARDLYIPRY